MPLVDGVLDTHHPQQHDVKRKVVVISPFHRIVELVALRRLIENSNKEKVK